MENTACIRTPEAIPGDASGFSCLEKKSRGPISDEAHSAVVAASGRLGGQLALGASQTIAQYLLPNLIAAFLRENPSVSITPVIRRRECRSIEGGQSRLWICKANGVAFAAELFGESSRSAEIGFPETRWPLTRSRSMPRGDDRCKTLKADIDNVKTMWDLSRSERTSNQR